jgi:hypothetical protein
LFITSTATLHKDKLPSACTPKKLRRKKTKGIPQKSSNNNNTEPIHHRLHHELLLQGLLSSSSLHARSFVQIVEK